MQTITGQYDPLTYGICALQEQNRAFDIWGFHGGEYSSLRPEDGGSKVLRNVAILHACPAMKHR